MMILMGFYSLIVLFLGKAGRWVVWRKKAGFTYRIFKKSLLMLVPFVMIVVGLKQQGHRMKDIMDYLKQNSDVNVTAQIDPLFNNSSDINNTISDFESQIQRQKNWGGHKNGNRHHNRNGGRHLSPQ
jgi:hypothetical protein